VTMDTGLLARKTRVALEKARCRLAMQRCTRVPDGQPVVEVAGQVIRIGNWGLFVFVSCAFGAGVAARKKAEPTADRAPAGAIRSAARPTDASPAPDGGKAGSEVAADPSATLENLVVFITERSRFPLAVADAEERLRFLGPIRREEHSAGELPAVLTLFWERAPGLRVQVEYQFDGAWKSRPRPCSRAPWWSAALLARFRLPILRSGPCNSRPGVGCGPRRSVPATPWPLPKSATARRS